MLADDRGRCKAQSLGRLRWKIWSIDALRKKTKCPGERQRASQPHYRAGETSLHDRLKAAGAQFAQVFGWERARWYDPSGEGETHSFKRSNWWGEVREECLAVRDRVGLMDLSTFAKFEVAGPDALAFLQRICANRVRVSPGQYNGAPEARCTPFTLRGRLGA